MNDIICHSPRTKPYNVPLLLCSSSSTSFNYKCMYSTYTHVYSAPIRCCGTYTQAIHQQSQLLHSCCVYCDVNAVTQSAPWNKQAITQVTWQKICVVICMHWCERSDLVGPCMGSPRAVPCSWTCIYRSSLEYLLISQALNKPCTMCPSNLLTPSYLCHSYSFNTTIIM